MVSRRIGTGLACLCIAALTGLSACNVDGRWGRLGGPDGPEAPRPGSERMNQMLSNDVQEVDMVEAVVANDPDVKFEDALKIVLRKLSG